MTVYRHHKLIRNFEPNYHLRHTECAFFLSLSTALQLSLDIPEDANFLHDEDAKLGVAMKETYKFKKGSGSQQGLNLA
jgi:hypothetical protein